MLDNGIYVYDCWRVLATGVPDLHNVKPSKYG